jgi:hypothetical protein
MTGDLSRVCSGVLWGRGGLQFWVQGGEETLFSFWVGGEEKAPRPTEFELCFYSMSALQTALISILYKQSLQWWFLRMRLQACVGSVCVGGTALMCRGRNVHGWVRQLDVSPSTCHWTVEVYVPQVPPQEEPVVFGYIEVPCERYT